MISGPFYEVGVYVGEVISQGLTKAKTGTTQFMLRFKVLGKPDPADESGLIAVVQYERTMYMPITEKTAERVAENLRLLGYTADSFGPLEPSHPKHESFVGQQVDLYCKHENDQSGNPRERWQLSRKSDTKIEPLESRDVRQLDMLFGKTLKNVGAPLIPNMRSASVKAPAYASVADGGRDVTEITDDDIPF